jgi:hypothetical protein
MPATDENDERWEAAKQRAPVVLGGLLGLLLAGAFHLVLRMLGLAMSKRSEAGIGLALVGLIGPVIVHALITAWPALLEKSPGSR